MTRARTWVGEKIPANYLISQIHGGYTWNAILAPAGTPAPIIERLNAAMQKAMDDPAVIKRLQEVGIDPTPGRGPKEAADFIKAELAKWAPIIKASGASID